MSGSVLALIEKRTSGAEAEVLRQETLFHPAKSVRFAKTLSRYCGSPPARPAIFDTHLV